MKHMIAKLLIPVRPTAQVLDHFDHEINEVLGGVEDTNGQKQQVRVALLAGADLVRLLH
jgi:nicotinamide mononucleotide adenylyltransferase